MRKPGRRDARRAVGRPHRLRFQIGVVAGLLAYGALAQEGRIEDNSFLIEEAYNQGAGVVQHISTFNHAGEGSAWIFTFTQEWPFFDQRHQLSYSVPIAHIAGTEGVGDVALNYRFQWIGVEGGPLAVAPRLSLLLPTGNDERQLGVGSAGLQLNLPVSLVLAERWVAHWNVGGSFVPDAKGPAGATADVHAVQMGQGLIYLLRPTLNLLLEAIWTRGEVVTEEAGAVSEESFFVSPGVRFAINRPSGLQIVPGVAVPIGVGPSAGNWSIFLYLSFEHPFGRSEN